MQRDMATTAVLVPSWPEWYNENLESLNDDTRAVLENYSGLSSERVIPHVTELVRSRESRLCYRADILKSEIARSRYINTPASDSGDS